jgi:DNA polymerase-3 subunit delta
MPPLTREALRDSLRSGEILPVYVLFGPETQLLQQAVKFITDRAFAEGDLRDFNEDTFSLNNEGNLKRALAAAEQLPMMASRRVVRITEVRISATGHRDTIKEEDEAAIMAYLADPSPTSIVIFVADELNGVRRMGKLLREKAPAFEFTPLEDKDLGAVARKAFNEAGVSIDEAAFRLFMSRVGPDVRRVNNEVNKLAAAALPENVATAELVEALVPFTREIDNFAITNNLVEGRRSDAIAALHKILDDGVEPLQLLGSIAYSYRSLLVAKDLMNRGAERREVTGAVRLPPAKHEGFLAAARRSDLKQLERAIQRIAETDLNIKTSKGGSGPAAARMQLEVLVCELAVS